MSKNSHLQLAGCPQLLTVSVAEETGVSLARQRAKQLASLLGFDRQDQIRIATATSEIARNATQYGREGRVEFFADVNAEPGKLLVRVTDRGPGIEQPAAILDGCFQSPTGMGIGISGTRRLMDYFALESKLGEGTTVIFAKTLPKGHARLDARHVARLVEQLAREKPSANDEARQQNQELLLALDLIRKREAELEKRQDDLAHTNQELEETNRGVVALYAELDERASALRQANEVKTRFLSYMSHEFRTPLNSILALTELLLRRVDGDLTTEQERQIKFVRSASRELYEMVNDLLDIAKVESGKVDVRINHIEVANVFSALRGMMRPLLQNEQVNLVFEEPPAGLRLQSDEGKISQILRNLVSNALKFTERGEICVSASCSQGLISISVLDTGIGIAPGHQESIFEEFAQIENPVQRRVRGTGLGLPLSRKLAELLGGTLTVNSALGQGSTFRLSLPVGLADSLQPPVPSTAPDASSLSQPPAAPAKDRHQETVLVIDDDETSRYLASQLFRKTRYLITEATGGMEGLERARFDRPCLILLDMLMPDRHGLDVFEDLKTDPATRDIPIVLHTSSRLSPADLAQLNGRQAAILPKSTDGREPALMVIRGLLNEPHLS